MRVGMGLGLGARSAAPEWTPARLGFTAWYRADQGITLNGSTVSQWDDISGNGNHLVQGTGSAQPTYVASSSYFGVPALSFDGGDRMNCAALSATIKEITYFAVGRGVTVANNGIAAITNGGTVNTGTAMFYTAGAMTVRRASTGGAAKAVTYAAKHVVIGTADATAANIYVDSATAGTAEGAKAYTGYSHLTVGDIANALIYPWNGEIAEVGILNRVATAAEISALLSYASRRYGITIA